MLTLKWSIIYTRLGIDQTKQRIKKMTNSTETKIYIVREMSTSDNPADEGNELKRFRGKNGWEKAATCRDTLYTEDGIKSYISIKNI